MTAAEISPMPGSELMISLAGSPGAFQKGDEEMAGGKRHVAEAFSDSEHVLCHDARRL
jgi:hypothetical protein